MLTRWTDVPSTSWRMADFRDQMDRLFDVFSRGFVHPDVTTTVEPPVNLYDTGDALVVEAEVPGVKIDDIEITAHQDVLRLSVNREVVSPEGYRTHRAERRSGQFTRSFGLSVKCDLEKVSATAKNGILTVTLPKAPESKPRQITVKTQ